MSSNATHLSIGYALTLAIAGFAAMPGALAAQDERVAERAEADEDSAGRAQEFGDTRINILITVPRGDVNEAQAQECEDRADAGAISGEIVVCRQLGEDGGNYYSGSRDAARKRYAEETAFKGAPASPDVAGAGIFRGPATVSGMCVIPPCPPPPAIFIDVEALPQAPEGSDADRIARGLPPLGEDPEPSAEEIAQRRRALGLPAPPVPGGEN